MKYFVIVLLFVGLFYFLRMNTETHGQGNVGKNLELATFAGGCFWCVESTFSKIPGVIKVTSGYIGGSQKDATYDLVSTGTTNHVEAIEIEFDPNQISYKELLDVYWQEIDPTDSAGQFADRGPQYKPAVFYHNDGQKQEAEESRANLEQLGIFDKSIVVEFLPVTEFYPAEDYHQDYYKKNPVHYNAYRLGSGRQGFIDKHWSDFKKGISKLKSKFEKPDQNTLKSSMTDIQYKVTQENATEPPFQNEYFDNKEPGIYVDIVTGEPLFSSLDKFDSGTGWPSFTKPISETCLIDKQDNSHLMQRTEVRSKTGDSHLGHVFDDGPGLDGKRYCINSASLKFIPVDELEKQGYGEYKKFFN